MKWLVLAALVACKSDDKPALSPCVPAIARVIAKSADAKQHMAKLAPKLVELCVGDAWADAVVQCFQTAADVARCKDGLEPEQRARYTREMMKVMMAGSN